MKLKVSDNRRFLVQGDGEPFFYLADTGWELFHRLDRDETKRYLNRRAAQGFTAIQCVALAELDGIHAPNAEGHLPLESDDPRKPQEGYFQDVDYAIDLMNDLGMVAVLLPTWGDKWNRKWGVGPEIFTPDNARFFGEWLGKRYRNRQVIWMLGGDRPFESEAHLAIVRAMAEGVKQGDGGAHLMTAHVNGGASTSQWLHNDEWLDFNTIQSGHHARNLDNHRMIAHDYGLTPTKPCMDAESAYEDHPVNWNDQGDLFSEVEVRRPMYWGVFAGGHGFTYGNQLVWQFLQPEFAPIGHAKGHWQEGVVHPVANQVRHLKRLMLSRPYLSRIPDQSLIVGDAGAGLHHRQATRDQDGSYAMVYLGTSEPVEVDLSKLSAQELWATWFDPRTGSTRGVHKVPRSGVGRFVPPSEREAQDWVLLLDDAARNYRDPGI